MSQKYYKFYRQTQVIYKGFNHLIQPNQDFLYIGDEVGLGKTYIALGIVMLLRHFSEQPHHYQDVIIVPKKKPTEEVAKRK